MKMNMKLKLESLSIVASIGLVGFVAGCPFVPVVGVACTDGGDECGEGEFCLFAEGACEVQDRRGVCTGVPDACIEEISQPVCGCDGVTYANECFAWAAGVSIDHDGECGPPEPEGFVNADAARGGAQYDKWWVVAGAEEPTDDHPFWATQDTNARTGADTWRCKECHGWDYKGVDGAYGSGSHMTGFAGISGTTLSAQGVFDKIKDDHGFGAAGLSDTDIWDLAKFVLDGQIDTDEFIDADNAFIGDAGNGQTLYDAGIGTNTACAVCHGADGLTINFKDPPDAEFIGGLARGNPWEFQHKVRFGHPGTAMPAAVDVGATNDDVADVGAYSQTLPTSTDPEGFVNASTRRGGSLYDKWWVVAGVDAPTDDHAFWAMQDTNTRSGADTWRCKECHGWDYKGVDGAYGSGSHMTGFAGIFGTALSAQEVFDKVKDGHGFGTAGLSDEDVWDLAKFVLEGGQRDTDDIIDADGVFIGDAANGDTLYNNGIGGTLACMICHGADGQTINFKDPPDEEFIGGLANGNPWEFQHKVWYGHPGTAMPAAVDVDATNDDVADVGAHAQTLP